MVQVSRRRGEQGGGLAGIGPDAELSQAGMGGTEMGFGRQRIVGEKAVAVATISREHAPGKQTAHIELPDPGAFEDILGQLEAEFALCNPLRLDNEVGLMLQRRDLLQNGHDAIERLFHGAFVGRQTRILIDPAQRMRRGTTATAAKTVNRPDGAGAAQWRAAGRTAGCQCGLSG